MDVSPFANWWRTFLVPEVCHAGSSVLPTNRATLEEEQRQEPVELGYLLAVNLPSCCGHTPMTCGPFKRGEDIPAVAEL